ncbi:coiled-coil-helix-coiled-coil-helix domain-containing protein 7 [Elysia marginata]|uniref:Coiled-coil-helix-coiled-coil-helix domain-containing protein 7 n=1 Tax=Elysia marginata TaxID=1093978 RepID=A0AAV4EWL9_9GAST|nr:coiled-coil-helix-coiled-coil-helix domain-containing protein 7 [Elysia marginata]
MLCMQILVVVDSSCWRITFTECEEHQMTMQCLDDNGYDRAQCEKFYENYRNCKKFWSWIAAERKRRGITPHLPAPEDREAVKQEYIHFMHKT